MLHPPPVGRSPAPPSLLLHSEPEEEAGSNPATSLLTPPPRDQYLFVGYPIIICQHLTNTLCGPTARQGVRLGPGSVLKIRGN